MNRQLTKLSLVALLICLFSGLAYAQEPSGYYKKAEGKSQKELLKQLCEIVGPHKNVGYNGLWNVYKDSDIRPGTNYYWDMYSTSKFREGQQKCGNYSNVGDCVNREHSFPKSWFKEGQPMVSDAFHIYPTDGKVNGQRSNFPYGECANGTTLPSCNGVDALGKLGKSTFLGYSGTVFEPVDEYKGDFARSYFYMAACYNDKIASWSSPMLAGNSYPCYTTWAVNLLLKWNEQDPVSQKEIDRNNAVYKHQNNRNPFIDHPELAEYIWGDKQNIGWTPGGVVDPKITSPYNGSTVDFGVTAVNTTLTYTVNVKAEGLTQNVAVSVAGAGFKASAASIAAADANKGTSINLTYSSAVQASATGTLTLTSGSAKSVVTLKAQAVDGIPALSASNVTANGFTARWVDVDKNGGDYTLNVYLADGTTLVPGFPKTVKAAAQQYAVTDLEYLTEYKYQLSNVKGMKSNLVSVTTVDLDREISFDLPEGGLVLSAAPGVDSAPVKVTVYASNVEENEIDVSVTKGFQVSADKSDWRSSLAVDTKTAETIGAEIYVRIPASAAGTYDGTLSASTATVEGDDVNVKAVVTAPVTFFEDFEKPGAGPYNTFNYNGSACKWSVVNAGIAAREGDKVHGTQALCTGKKGERSLTVRDAVVRVEGENGAIINIDALVLEGCGVTEPVGAKFDAALRGVALDGALVKGKVVIGPVTYGVNVAGVALTGKNCGDLSVIPGVEGMASFDPATNTLSLGNATITGNVAVNSMIPDLKIMLIGENNFISSDKGICTIGALTVLGPGTLNIKAKNDGIMTVASPVVIDGAKVSINAEMGVAGAKCIVGDADVGDERLVVRKADVEITSVLGAVPAIGDVQLDGCHITEPAGAAFDSAMRALVFEGKPVEKLVIRPDADGIHDITADIPESRRGTFNMQGVKLDVDWDSLPAGIYIVDGVKKVKF